MSVWLRITGWTAHYCHEYFILVCVSRDSMCIFLISHVSKGDKRQADVWWQPTTSRQSKQKWVHIVWPWLISSLFQVNEVLLFFVFTQPLLWLADFLMMWIHTVKEISSKKKGGRLAVPWNDASLLGYALFNAPLSGSLLWSRPLYHPWGQQLTER